MQASPESAQCHMCTTGTVMWCCCENSSCSAGATSPIKPPEIATPPVQSQEIVTPPVQSPEIVTPPVQSPEIATPPVRSPGIAEREPITTSPIDGEIGSTDDNPAAREGRFHCYRR
ncbi:bifunctional inhibitor/plant lipid transfer protein/seed storage helical domain-containing protein [Plakobranchus ocellatus]|uniref:Bifunctional inhibitor/plant lipid transfer protein/seed storage helical domain-containing protein n=1 Tax=Plakobranchus ocellatus TaxID=259542 RepID=A0AAV4AP28_9GAST|nr:bifunctional inhibitor/plant lipid transfer protein/seed storage helical domain-containing protein [Plakobranchus ocellatus]